MFSGALAINSLKLKWVLGTLILSVLGYLLILHGAMTLDGVHGDNTSTWFYHLEIYVGCIFTWPVTIYGWFQSTRYRW